MIGSNNTFIYTASLCECNSWRKSLTGVLETTVARREKRKSHKEVCFAALPVWPCSTTRINIVYRKKNAILAPLHETDVRSSFSSLCRQGICSSGSSWDDIRKTLPSFSIYFSHNLTSNSWKNRVFIRPIPCVISLLKLLATTFPLRMTFSRTPLCSRIYQTSALCYSSVCS